MPPQQQMPPAGQSNPYEFILNAGNNQPKSRFSLPGGSSMPKKILVVFGIGCFLLIAIILLVSLLGGGSGSSDKLIAIAQEQTELIRVADLAINEKSVKNPTTVSFASNVSLSVNSSKVKLVPLIPKGKANDKILALKKNSKTDAKLKDAVESNKYDETVLAELNTELKAYRADLAAAYKEAKTNKIKEVLKTAYDGTNILLGATN